jgi:hypothetical protein
MSTADTEFVAEFGAVSAQRTVECGAVSFSERPRPNRPNNQDGAAVIARFRRL